MKDRADALYVVGDALVISHRVQINTLALIARLPTTYIVREHVVVADQLDVRRRHLAFFRQRVRQHRQALAMKAIEDPILDQPSPCS